MSFILIYIIMSVINIAQMHPVPLASLPTNESSLFLQSITEVINPDTVFYEYDRLAEGYLKGTRIYNFPLT